MKASAIVTNRSIHQDKNIPNDDSVTALSLPLADQSYIGANRILKNFNRGTSNLAFQDPVPIGNLLAKTREGGLDEIPLTDKNRGSDNNVVQARVDRLNQEVNDFRRNRRDQRIYQKWIRDRMQYDYRYGYDDFNDDDYYNSPYPVDPRQFYDYRQFQPNYFFPQQYPFYGNAHHHHRHHHPHHRHRHHHHHQSHYTDDYPSRYSHGGVHPRRRFPRSVDDFESNSSSLNLTSSGEEAVVSSDDLEEKKDEIPHEELERKMSELNVQESDENQRYRPASSSKQTLGRTEGDQGV